MSMFYISNKFIAISSFILLFFTYACKDPAPSIEPVVIPNYDLYQLYYTHHNLDSLVQNDLRNVALDTGLVDRFYITQHYQACWINQQQLTDSLPRANYLLKHLATVESHGLSQNLFNYQLLQSWADSICEGKGNSHSMALLDYHMSKAYIAYVTILQYGLLKPKAIFTDGYHIETQIADTNHYVRLFAALTTKHEIRDAVYQVVNTAQIVSLNYLAMQNSLLFYQSIQPQLDALDTITIPANVKSYALNDKSLAWNIVAKRLHCLGWYQLADSLQKDTILNVNQWIDSLNQQLTPELFQSINQFRLHQSYLTETSVSVHSLRAINRKATHYISQLIVNLERERWRLSSPLGDKYIYVNVPAFQLYAVHKNIDTLVMNVCVGSAKSNQTPLMQSLISYMNLNPTWNVPQSIIRGEIARLQNKNNHYLAGKNMKIFNPKGNVVDPKSINWSTAHNKYFPYYIVQASGNANSLGRIKFMFANSFSVYLHDTPSKKAFNAQNRAVSHGCVRVQRPIDLAFFCMKTPDSVYFDHIRYALDLPPLTSEGQQLLAKQALKPAKDIQILGEKIPILIDYKTVFIDSDQLLRFTDDVYTYDSVILESIKTCL